MFLFWLPACLPASSSDLEAEVRRLDAEVASLRAEVDALEQANLSLLEALTPLLGGVSGLPRAPEPLPADPEVLGHEERCVSPEVLAALSDPERFALSARAIPHVGPDSTPDGFRVSGVRRGHEVDQLGVRNGDILRSIDGNKLTSIEAAKTSYDKIVGDKPERVTIALSRRGFDHEIVLRMRDCEPPAAIE